ncbi:MAG: HAMP domain-containing protein [Drouetiella hepatica Uher 2000/2452]|uniref:histidine kinase n=1 Tax=Drouetiella hepatica Uher 2000/2452 TaxID=904376 RepID=A0A951Q7N5_9CYAN|nr:HAMP domain-containing protein [Drouetiella hepatica Uher 2000/2452]
MKQISRFRESIAQSGWRYLNPTSLQFRLTSEIAILSVLCLGSVGLWTSWKMQQILIATHQQNVEYIADRFPRDVELYSEMLSVKTGLQKTINNVSNPSLLIWVKGRDSQILAQSESLRAESPANKAALMSLAEMPSQPQVYGIGDRYVVLRGSSLTVKNQLLGNVYIAQDVTANQQQLISALQGLVLVSALAIVITLIAITLRIRRSLRPLQEMSQIAGAISAEDLSSAQLPLNRAPSEVKELAETFNLMLSRLSNAWENQRQFVGNVSHELRTPLTIVHGYLQSVLRRSTNLSAYQQEALETAAAEADRTVRMLEDLLNLARADNGHLYFRQEPVLLNALVVEVAEMTQKVSNRQVTVTAPNFEIWVQGDRDRLQQVLINLVDNAIKYSAADQPVDLILEQGQQVMVHVRDRGVGISLQHQNRIFERFYRVDETMTRSRDGTGLGLAIAKSLIESMAGCITLRSKPTEGSIFTVVLPVWKSPA